MNARAAFETIVEALEVGDRVYALEVALIALEELEPPDRRGPAPDSGALAAILEHERRHPRRTQPPAAFQALFAEPDELGRAA